jgi:peptidoglycan hydrolase-like protein with peptidoglycan-binding domain
MRFPAAAIWAPAAFPAGNADGVLTSVDVTSGQMLSSGQLLYTVAMRPVTLIEGDIPVFRDMTPGVEGADVAQLRAFLHTAGYLRTAQSSPKFDALTEAAVKRWQKAIGLEADGVVRAADVIFASGLPVRAAVAAAVGDHVSPGTAVVTAVAAVPSFAVTLASDQAATVPTEGAVTVSGDGHTWSGVISSAEQRDTNLVLTLTGADGGALCGADCSTLTPPADGSTAVFQADFIIVPQTSGPLIPVAAIGLDASGSHVVTRTDGTQVKIVIVAASDGIAVVQGVEAGDEVLLIAPDDGDGTTEPGP